MVGWWDWYQDIVTDVQNMFSYVTSHNKFVSCGVLLDTAKPGDLIEFCRGAHSHWAMMSEHPGMVYNICVEHRNLDFAEIRLESLRDVCDQGPSPRRRRARVNNKGRFRGSLPLSPEESLELAKEMEGTVVPYECTLRNCEHYCILWKFGTGASDQAFGY